MHANKGPFCRSLILSALAAAMVLPTASQAGVVNGVQTGDGLTVYFGVVPAAIAQRHPSSHPEATMHGGPRRPDMHNMHLVAALFNSASGARITRAKVTAKILEPGGRQWNVELTPMTVNGALTFGGFTTFERNVDYSITISVDQLGAVKRLHAQTLRFEWAHD